MVSVPRLNSSITNFGQSGWSSDALINGDQGHPGQLTRAHAEVQAANEQGRGSVVFIWIGSNDLWYLYGYGGDVNNQGGCEDLPGICSDLAVMLSGLRPAGPQVILSLLDDHSPRPVAVQLGECSGLLASPSSCCSCLLSNIKSIVGALGVLGCLK